MFFLIIHFTSSRFMRTECINHQYAFDKPMPVTRLMDNVSNSTKNSFFRDETFHSIHLRMSSSNSTLWSSTIRCWFSDGWLRCTCSYPIPTSKTLLSSLNRRKAHIYINYVHRRIIIRVNQWLLVHVLNQHERILKRI